MKDNTASANKMIKNFDEELKSLLITDLKIARAAGKVITKKITSINATEPHLFVA